MKLIKRTVNGQITYCPGCNIFHLEFGNVLMNLTRSELKNFKKNVNGINYKYYLNLNKNTFNNRKIVLQIQCKNAYFCLNENEFIELKDLLALKNNTRWLKAKEISSNKLIFN